MEIKIYVKSVKGKKVLWMESEWKKRIIRIDNKELKLKLEIIKRKYEELINMVSNDSMVGQ
jgi:coatomer protein complex subunit alpha (xenin)